MPMTQPQAAQASPEVERLTQQFIDTINAANVDHRHVLNALLSTLRIVAIEHRCCMSPTINAMYGIGLELAKLLEAASPPAAPARVVNRTLN